MNVLEAVYALFVARNAWPRFVEVDRYLDQRGESNAEEVLLALPAGLIYGVNPRSRSIPDDQEVTLTVAAMASIDQAREELDRFLQVVRLATELEANTQPDDPEPRLSAVEVGNAVELPETARPALLARVAAILRAENWGWTGASWEPDWSFTFNRRVRRFRGVDSIEDYWTRAHADQLVPETAIDEAVDEEDEKQSTLSPQDADLPELLMELMSTLEAAEFSPELRGSTASPGTLRIKFDLPAGRSSRSVVTGDDDALILLQNQVSLWRSLQRYDGMWNGSEGILEVVLRGTRFSPPRDFLLKRILGDDPDSDGDKAPRFREVVDSDSGIAVRIGQASDLANVLLYPLHRRSMRLLTLRVSNIQSGHNRSCR